MSFRKIGEFVSPWFGKARNAFGCRLSVAKCPKIWILRYAQYDKSRGVGVLLTFGCSLAVILSVAKNPHFKGVIHTSKVQFAL